MQNIYYAVDPYKKQRKQVNLSIEKLKKLSDIMKHSSSIHIILVCNGDYSFSRFKRYKYQDDYLRRKIPEMVQNIEDLYEKRNEHFVIVFYGDSVRCITPIVPLQPGLNSDISNIVQHEWYDFEETITRDMIMDAFKTGLILKKPGFEFLVKYEKIFVHEVV